MDELCWKEAPLKFLKMLYENVDENKNKRNAEIMKTSHLSNAIVCCELKNRVRRFKLNYFQTKKKNLLKEAFCDD